MNMHSILKSLSNKRPVFHSEADFQHALAWEVHLFRQCASIRLEKQVATPGSRVHLDMLVTDSQCNVAVELKYKTKAANLTWNGEGFYLRKHGAYDHGRYDFLKDLQRIESYLRSNQGSEGYVIFLTNDETYWTKSNSKNNVDAAFHIDDERIITGKLEWDKNASSGTTKGRQSPIVINGSYTMKWHDYSQFVKDNEIFRYVLVHVPPVSSTGIIRQNAGSLETDHANALLEDFNSNKTTKDVDLGL